jgi:tetratricopeptide (TPR) repeat protein
LLDDTRKSGVFAEHEAQVQRVLLQPLGLRAAIEDAVPRIVGRVRAIHANYVLDSLPFTILSSSRHGLFELRLRTRVREELLPHGVEPPATSDARATESWLDALVSVSSASARTALTLDAEYVRVGREELPYAELVPALPEDGLESGRQWVHSFGAIQCLADALSLLQPDGYVIISDYGYDGARPEPIEFQMFGSSMAAGVNFAQLIAYAQSRSDCLVGVPEADPTSLQTRFFARARVAQDVAQLFRTQYGKEAAERAETPYREAVELASNGQYEAARWKFEQAHRLQPWNWSLQEAMVSFLTYTLEDHDAGLEICKRALELNHLSPRLWNLLGDCYYGQGTLDSAEQAYRQAIRVSPSDVRGRTNLAYVFLKRRASGDALRIIGEALALDQSGACREELLAKQNEALQALSAEHLREVRANLKRLSGHHALPHRKRS